jgi:diguanylate cyclase (GGDEF)-like protein/PAS domain S-box-containing protein
VLAVDDNATIRKAISMRLGSRGYDVITAADGLGALAVVNRGHVDLVLLDLQMPGMRGEEVLQQIRTRFSQTELPVIMLAASADRNDIRRSLELGANDYVTKPGELPLLLARIKTQLSLKRTAEKLRAAEFSTTNIDRNRKDIERTLDHLAHHRVHEELLGDLDSSDEFRYHVLYDNTPMTCFTVNYAGEVLYANQFGLQFLGYERSEVINKSIYALYAPDDQVMVADQIGAAMAAPGRTCRWDIRRRRKDGSIYWARETAVAIRQGDDGMILMTSEDINDTHLLAESLSFQTTHDELTGLANRKSLGERLTQVLDSAHSENTEHALAIVNLDQFKFVNDSSGHDAGDELLRQVAKLLKSVVRKRDTLARLSSDEFAVLIEDCDARQARENIEVIRQVIDAFEFRWQGRKHVVTASIGLVNVNSRCDDANSVLSMADTACFAAKDSGRNRVHVYEKDHPAVSRHQGEMRWATRINDALADNRFELNFQRIRPVGDSCARGDHYELLLRMRDELGNIVMPAEFLPAAERYDLSPKVDRWVIGAALDWLRRNPALAARLHLCGINLSGQSLSNEDVVCFILEQLEHGGIPAEKICFEVTETAAVSDLVQANHFITLLKDRGCKFALDDFGSGFSSFAYLKKLPVDFLKIDGSFVRDIATDSIDLAMVRSINEIGHMMGKHTIAEFVEDRKVLDILKRVGVDYAQGYEIGRPEPLDKF